MLFRAVHPIASCERSACAADLVFIAIALRKVLHTAIRQGRYGLKPDT